MDMEMRRRKNSMQDLLYDLYESVQSPSHNGMDTESWTTDSTTNSLFSEFAPNRKGKHSAESLKLMSVRDLRYLHSEIQRQSTERSQRLVKELKRRDHQLSRAQAKCNLLTATLQALSPKRSVDTKLQFSLEPPNTDCGYDQWLNAMRAVARLPDGIPHHFRKKLWLTLAQHHIQASGIDWKEVCVTCFNERMNPDDDKLGMQIIKDLHRTGWTGLSGEHERIYLKRVLLAYARYNKTIGYCQGLNVIAALVLDVLEFREENALKVMIFLLEQVLPCGYFDQTLRALLVDMAVLRDLMNSRLPKLATHLDHLQKSSESEYEPPLTNVFSMQWFLTLFATCLPRNAVFRVWDSLMLEGSEVLLRTALAIWAKIARRVHRTNSADQFYGVMGGLCGELLQMSPSESNDLLQVIYTMAEFPYPGLTELRDKYTWNIQPFSSTFRVLRQQVASILHSDSDDNDDYKSNTQYGGCASGRGSSPTDMGSLQKQYKLIKQRQKQASVILQNAYERGQNKLANSSKAALTSPTQSEIFNHLYVGKTPPTGIYATMSGTMPVSSRTVQPSGKARHTIDMRQTSPDSPRRWTKTTTDRYDSSSISTATPDITTVERSRCSTIEFGESLSSGESTPQAHLTPTVSMHDLTTASGGRTCLRRGHSALDMTYATLAPVPPQSCGRQCHWSRKESLIRSSRKCKSLNDLHTAVLENKFVSRKISVAESESLFRSMSAQKGKKLLEQRRVQQRRVSSSNDSQNTVNDTPVRRHKAQKDSALIDKSKAILNSIAKQDKTAKYFNPFPTRHTSKLIEKERKMGLY